MKREFTILDERNVWFGPAMDAARKRGYAVERVRRGSETTLGGLGFIRPHAIPAVLEQNHADYMFMVERLTMAQDFAQVEVYEDKSAQFWRWGGWMPPTWRFESKTAAMQFLASPDAPTVLVSKADVGASSKNVRILKTRAEQAAHIMQLFGRGIQVDHCAGGPGGRSVQSLQRGYVLLQQYIPHSTTYRVNAVGRGRAIFKRYSGAQGTAVTGNVEPVKVLDDFSDRLLAFSNDVFADIGSRWCALDVLEYKGVFRLIETSLAWPWPSPGDCDNAPFFGDVDRKYQWRDMWELLLDEYEAGVWSR